MAEKALSLFERQLTIWVFLTIAVGTLLGWQFPYLAGYLERLSYAQVSIPTAICLFFMMFSIMVRIDFTRIKLAARTPRPVVLTMVVNRLIKPFTMYAIAYFSWGSLAS